MVMGGTVFVGCTLIGLGIGLLFGQPGPGVLIGIGVGFVLMGFSQPVSKFMRYQSGQRSKES